MKIFELYSDRDIFEHTSGNHVMAENPLPGRIQFSLSSWAIPFVTELLEWPDCIRIIFKSITAQRLCNTLNLLPFSDSINSTVGQ